jgi:hypothetical protein
MSQTSPQEPCASPLCTGTKPDPSAHSSVDHNRSLSARAADATDLSPSDTFVKGGSSFGYSLASPLCAIPAEILENIVLEAVLATPLGPPSVLIPILCTCKRIYNKLRFENNRSLYARIFNCKFDVGAARRRFGPHTLPSSSLADQLQSNIMALQDIRQGDIYSSHVNSTLWTAFFLMLENDGKNREQLDWAGLDSFIDRYIRNRLSEGRDQHKGWPVENEGNSLALWLMVMTLTEGRLFKY